jgi:hypothetical protein
MNQLLTEAATWLGYSGFCLHFTCKDLYERRPEGPPKFRLELAESDMSPNFPGAPGRYRTIVEGFSTYSHFLKGWLNAWERAIFDVARLRFGRHCRNLRVVASKLRLECWDAKTICIDRNGIYEDPPDELRRLPYQLYAGIGVYWDAVWEQMGLEPDYRHMDYSWLNVGGVTYRVCWSRPTDMMRMHGDGNGGIRGYCWLEITVWGRYDPILFQVSSQALPRLPAGSQRF